jgi:hypothetical protein
MRPLQTSCLRRALRGIVPRRWNIFMPINLFTCV